MAVSTGGRSPQSLAALYRSTESWRELYDLQRAYYDSTGLYDEVFNQMLHIVDLAATSPEMQGLRNPAHRAVEFYPAKLWPGSLPRALPIETSNERLRPVIERIWRWSNWGARKQVAARWLALYGDLFIRVAERERAVYLQLVDPRFVPDFEEDDRGFVTHCRSDVPQVTVDDDGDEKERTLTEEWNKDEGTYRWWLHDRGYSVDVGSLGAPDGERGLLDTFGIDFVPVTHAKFQDIGDDRGQSCFGPAIDKIDEANRMVTRLHGLLFRHNKPDRALESSGAMVDGAGRPMSPPGLGDNDTITVSLDEEQVYRLPAGWNLRHLIPDIKYREALEVLQSHMSELERDLPELAWGRIREQTTDISGRALRFLLDDAVARTKEARGYAESALRRAQQMAITVGQQAGLDGFDEIGTYETGALAHRFKARPVIPLGENERAEMFSAFVKGGLSTKSALILAGYGDQKVKRIMRTEEEMAEREQGQMAQALMSAQRNFSQQGAAPPEEAA